MGLPLPIGPFRIIHEMLRCLALCIEGKMLVIEVQLRVIKVGHILPVLRGCSIMLVGALIGVFNTVVEQPVGNQSLFLARDMFAIECDQSSLTFSIESFRNISQWCGGMIPPEDQAEKIPLGTELI
ncbi:hypothetical protein D3C77_498460 [compost metagenome]